MSLDKVKAAVLDEAKAKAGEKLREAGETAKYLLAEGKAADERASAEAVRDATLRLERDAARERERALHENRLQVLAGKNQAIDDVFRRVREKIAAFSDAEYTRLVGAWLSALPSNVGGELRVNPKDKAKFAESLDDFNQNRFGAGLFSGVAADPGVSSGVVVKGPDFHVDCTVDRRLAELREAAAGDLARKLFGA